MNAFPKKNWFPNRKPKKKRRMALVQMLTRSLISMKKKEQQQKKRTNKPRTATAEVWRLIASLTRPNLESVGRLFFLNFLSFFFFDLTRQSRWFSSNVQKFILFYFLLISMFFFVFFSSRQQPPSWRSGVPWTSGVPWLWDYFFFDLTHQ